MRENDGLRHWGSHDQRRGLPLVAYLIALLNFLSPRHDSSHSSNNITAPDISSGCHGQPVRRNLPLPLAAEEPDISRVSTPWGWAGPGEGVGDAASDGPVSGGIDSQPRH